MITLTSRDLENLKVAGLDFSDENPLPGMGEAKRRQSGSAGGGSAAATLLDPLPQKTRRPPWQRGTNAGTPGRHPPLCGVEAEYLHI